MILNLTEQQAEVILLALDLLDVEEIQGRPSEEIQSDVDSVTEAIETLLPQLSNFQNIVIKTDI